jgi:LysM repeat protein
MNNPTNNDDKTRIFSHEDENNGEPHSDNITLNKSDKADNSNTKGIHPGILAAGIGAAAVGGVAAGTAYSDEIKDGLGISDSEDTVHTAQVNQSSNGIASAAPTEAVDSHTADINNSSNTHAHSLASTDHNPHNDVTHHGHDDVYRVAAEDHGYESDVESIRVEAELVDGSHVEYTASGPILDSIMMDNDTQYAQGNDYIQAANNGSLEGNGPSSGEVHDYEIKYGDTLSELAAEHNTSVARIMELNPHLENPNIIMAGEHIVLPENDHISNPYDGWQAEWSQTPQHDVHPHAVEITHGNMEEDFNMEEEYNTEEYYQEGDYLEAEEISFDDNGTSGEFESMDWESFEDQPMDDYSSHLEHTDFNAYDDPNAYLDQSNDIDSSEFC